MTAASTSATKAASKTIAVTDASFDLDVNKSSLPVLVDFWAPWCGPCLAIAPSLEAIAKEYEGRVVIAKMNVDEHGEAPARLGIRSIPFLALYKDGQVVETLIGSTSKERIAALINKSLV